MAHHCKKKRALKYTSAIVADWRKIRKENDFSNAELAAHLHMNYDYMMNIFQKDAHGELA